MGQRLAIVMRTMKKMMLITFVTVVIVVASQVISDGGQKHRRVVNCRENSFSVLCRLLLLPPNSSDAERRPTQQGRSQCRSICNTLTVISSRSSTQWNFNLNPVESTYPPPHPSGKPQQPPLRYGSPLLVSMFEMFNVTRLKPIMNC